MIVAGPREPDLSTPHAGSRVLAVVGLEDGRLLANPLIEGSYGRAYAGGERGD